MKTYHIKLVQHRYNSELQKQINEQSKLGFEFVGIIREETIVSNDKPMHLKRTTIMFAESDKVIERPWFKDSYVRFVLAFALYLILLFISHFTKIPFIQGIGTVILIAGIIDLVFIGRKL